MLRHVFMLLFAVASATSTETAIGWPHRDATTGALRHSALSLLSGSAASNAAAANLTMVIGTVQKHPGNPLFVQDKPWEPRLDNGYPNVVYDANAVGTDGPWRLWYGGCGGVHDCSNQFLLYANSTDGLSWEKPDLGRYNLAPKFPKLAKLGKHNNIVMFGGGLGIYHDTHEPDPTRKYKISGGAPAGCYSNDGSSRCVVGTAASPDGIGNWSGVQTLSFVKPWRPDCHTNLFFDERTERYMMTTRDFVSPDGRLISISLSSDGRTAHYTGNWTVNATEEYPPTVPLSVDIKVDPQNAEHECGLKCRATDNCAFFWVSYHFHVSAWPCTYCYHFVDVTLY